MAEFIEVVSRNAAFDELRRGKVGKKETVEISFAPWTIIF